ncbi:hypothetical protein [Moorena sp. SIO3I8]|uniref:hypothetical protein n=1 Tax=Moorena sp. SIO3I8 TaxID=2607833 RepID=UPI0013C21D1D|nr:hypothetical protein [Moorena sp. SIO3I8]NEO09245.1 hypothetical protein [Moorena sp. SIO3I8]
MLLVVGVPTVGFLLKKNPLQETETPEQFPPKVDSTSPTLTSRYRPPPTGVLYDLTFDSPEHNVGYPPSVGGSYSQASSIRDGKPTVQSSLFVLKNQPLVFGDPHGDENNQKYDQIEFNIGSKADHYFVSFDVLVGNPSGELKIFFDTPTIQILSFKLDQHIVISQVNNSGHLISKEIGSYDTTVVYKLLVKIDIRNNLWLIKIDNKLIHKGDFFAKSNDIHTIRFSHGNFLERTKGIVGVDNIRIVAN